MSPPKICIVGDNCVDLYPVQTKKFVGGNGVNTGVAVQRNGIHCGYLGIVGNDEDGKLIIETLQKEKIDCQRLRQSEGKTAWTIVHLEDGERIFFEDCLEVQRDFELEEKDYQYLKQYDWVHHTIFSNWNLEGKNQFQDYGKTILEQASRIKKSDIKKCIFICDINDQIYYGNYLKESTKFLFFNEINKVGETINKYTKRGDFILIKGSRCWQLEKVIKSID